MKTKTIKQIIVFKASPRELWNFIMDPEKHARFTGEPATNEGIVGGKFTAYGDYISGINLKLEQDKKIVQKWTSTDFPKGYFTEVSFEFKKKGQETKMIFIQKKVPMENYKKIAEGWKEFYWGPIQDILAGAHRKVLMRKFDRM
jgi:activator of HSP90 ATPase